MGELFAVVELLVAASDVFVGFVGFVDAVLVEVEVAAAALLLAEDEDDYFTPLKSLEKLGIFR